MSWLELYCYSITHNHFPEDKKYLISLLDEYEFGRFERYRFDRSRWTFATARWMVKTQLAAHLGQEPAAISISYNDNGKPFLAECRDLYFSISHTEKTIALAISNAEVGVDAELQDRRGQPWNNAKDFLNEHIAKLIECAPNEAAKKQYFARYWTAMEARVKLRGETLFGIKNTFGRTLPTLARDGMFADSECVYHTAGLKSDEQISVCMENKTLQTSVKNYEGDGFLPNLTLSSKLGFANKHSPIGVKADT